MICDLVRCLACLLFLGVIFAPNSIDGPLAGFTFPGDYANCFSGVVFDSEGLDFGTDGQFLF